MRKRRKENGHLERGISVTDPTALGSAGPEPSPGSGDTPPQGRFLLQLLVTRPSSVFGPLRWLAAAFVLYGIPAAFSSNILHCAAVGSTLPPDRRQPFCAWTK
jgi:hypothetical protein